MDEADIDLSTPLMMDMAYCKAFDGRLKPFTEQMKETVAAVTAINDRYGRPRMWPFIAADPNRKDVVTLVTEALEAGLFKGVKIYPVMGFTPDDKRLYPIYDYCVQRGVPITTHCQNGGIPGLQGYYGLAHPRYWKRVLRGFPELVLNLAHNDWTGTSWQRWIRSLILDYPNVYTDIAYDTEMWVMPRRYFRSIREMLRTPKVRDRVLFGTDWYMGRFLWTEASYLEWFTRHSARIPWCRVKFTADDMYRLTEANPQRFLGVAEGR
jgi:predicted TIM-barrel fold metal-dependent hydrolase